MKDSIAADAASVDSSLSRISDHAGRSIRAARVSNALRLATPRAIQALIMIPAAVLAIQLVRITFGSGGELLEPLSIIGLSLILPAIVFSHAIVRTAARRVSRADAIGAVDREIQAEDRLLAADSFLNVPMRDAFMEAAIHALAVRRTFGNAPYDGKSAVRFATSSVLFADSTAHGS